MKTLHFDLEVEVSNKEDEFNLTLQLRKLWFDYQASPQGQNLKMVGIQQVGVRSPRQSGGAATEAKQGGEGSHNKQMASASQIAAEMDTAVKFAKVGGESELASLIEDWSRRLRHL